MYAVLVHGKSGAIIDIDAFVLMSGNATILLGEHVPPFASGLTLFDAKEGERDQIFDANGADPKKTENVFSLGNSLSIVKLGTCRVSRLLAGMSGVLLEVLSFDKEGFTEMPVFHAELIEQEGDTV